MINENGLEQLISSCTTDNGTLIGHLYTNLIEENVQAGTLGTHFECAMIFSFCLSILFIFFFQAPAAYFKINHITSKLD